MLRALAVSMAMWMVSLGLCAAETTPAAGGAYRDTGNEASKQPSPTRTNSTTTGSPSGEDAAAENELFEAANKSRKLAGVPPLRLEESLRAAARAHAQRMVATEQLEHRFSDEPPLLERMAHASPLKMDRVGENIALSSSASSANDTFMHSPPHRQNLLDPRFNVAGIAAFWSKGRLYVVQDFARQVPSY